MLLVAACAPADSPTSANFTSVPIAAQPCIVPAGHANAATGRSAASVSLQITFVAPCDLSVRVSGVSFAVRYAAFAEVATARVVSLTRLAAPVVIYDAVVDGPQTATFNKNIGASTPGALDQLHEAICAGEATFELIGVNGAIHVDAPVIPSNTGKC